MTKCECYRYVIVPAEDTASETNWEMLNASVSTSWAHLKKNVAATEYLFEMTGEMPEVFKEYRWYCVEEIVSILESAEWTQ